MHKIFHSDTSDHYITNNFTRVSNIHEHVTRNSHFNFVLPKREGYIGNTFYFNGIQCWNSLPNHVKAIKNFYNFKSALKQHLKQETTQKHH